MNTVYFAVALCVFIILIVLVRYFSRKRKIVAPTRNNRRNAFRLSLWEHECTFTVPSSPDAVFYGSIRDISISGMRLISYEDLSGVDELMVNFELGDYFSLAGKIERRKRLDNGLYDFGVHFLPLDEKTEQKLFKILWDKGREKVVL
ncbi:PilZ domain-containing protein [Neobacillus soli]|uniref:PilZ domain-containing protein n=1 Tax=Neobacillus soli TaxID=220688 RepID=UPI0008271074|nr:PilZ domain-containing protein [Neobacillus soli]